MFFAVGWDEGWLGGVWLVDGWGSIERAVLVDARSVEVGSS